MNNTKGFLKNGAIFLILISATFIVLFKDTSLVSLVTALKTVKVSYIFIGIICMFIFIACEGINIACMLKMFSYDISFLKGIKYAFVGFFFSSITPSASGGQPMQIYYMGKDKIKIAHSSIVLLIDLASFQVATIGIAIISLVFNYDFVLKMNIAVKILILIGITTNLIVLAFILVALFSNRFINSLVTIAFKIMSKFKFIDVSKYREAVDREINNYKEGAYYIKNNKLLMMKVMITTIIRLCAIYSITFLVYKSFNLSSYSFFTVFSLQAILVIAVSAIPLPGAVGSSEGTFLTLFKTLFPAYALNSAMLLSRGISFYLFVIISGTVILCIKLFKNKVVKEELIVQ